MDFTTRFNLGCLNFGLLAGVIGAGWITQGTVKAVVEQFQNNRKQGEKLARSK